MSSMMFVDRSWRVGSTRRRGRGGYNAVDIRQAGRCRHRRDLSLRWGADGVGRIEGKEDRVSEAGTLMEGRVGGQNVGVVGKVVSEAQPGLKNVKIVPWNWMRGLFGRFAAKRIERAMPTRIRFPLVGWMWAESVREKEDVAVRVKFRILTFTITIDGCARSASLPSQLRTASTHATCLREHSTRSEWTPATSECVLERLELFGVELRPAEFSNSQQCLYIPIDDSPPYSNSPPFLPVDPSHPRRYDP
ncbi:hypothetical protein R3P38DRAFT_2797865 [Favolaschia claudopus]|uniref:Uncharacterized protein n=1 Tax=Favolaschia claudopus TaxID=2862362 RepID=A0AAW0A1U5_9AGAR